jgi:hypothetical protein
MSENITHVAVCDDCHRLLSRLPQICSAFQEAITHRELARLGSVTRATDRFNPPLLARIREGWAGREPAENLPRKLAFSLGALCHRAADRTFKPVFRALQPGYQVSPSDVSVYHDVTLFREVYKEGAEPPYSPDLFKAETAFEEHFRVLVQRALIAMHTFIPDVENAEAWLEQVIDLRQRFYVELARYAAAYNDPDPAKVERYIIEPNFYDETDPLLQLARAIQKGEAVSGAQVAEALEAEAGSQYDQAVRRGLRYLRVANGFFLGEMDADALRQGLEIGRPELAG